MQQQIQKEKVHSTMLKAGGKTYFFDVLKAKNGNNYLTICESYKNQKGEQTRNRLMLFKDHFSEFINSLGEVKQFM